MNEIQELKKIWAKLKMVEDSANENRYEFEQLQAEVLELRKINHRHILEIEGLREQLSSAKEEIQTVGYWADNRLNSIDEFLQDDRQHNLEE